MNKFPHSSAPAAGFALAPLKLRNHKNIVEYFATLVVTAACMGVLLFYLISGNSIISGTSVTSRSLTYVLLILGYISKGYSAMVSLAVIKCIKNSISDRLLEGGVPVQVVADNVYNTDQGPSTLRRRLLYPLYNWPILIVFAVSLAIPGISKASLQLTPVQYASQVVTSPVLDNKGCDHNFPQQYGCLTTPTGAFINATNVGLVLGTDNPVPLNMYVPCSDATAAGLCFATPVPLVLATGPTSNIVYGLYNDAAATFSSSCYTVDWTMADVSSTSGTTGTGYVVTIDNTGSSFLAATDFNTGALLTVGMSIADGNFLCDVSVGNCAADITWSGGVGEWQAFGSCTGEASYWSEPTITPARTAILPAQLSDLFGAEATGYLRNSSGTNTSYLLDVLGYAGKVAAALECNYDYPTLTQATMIETTVVGVVNAITVDKTYAKVTVGLLGANLVVLLLLICNMRSIYMPLNFTQLVCMASRVKDPSGLLDFRTGGKPEYAGLVSIVLEADEASLQVGSMASGAGKGQHQIRRRV